MSRSTTSTRLATIKLRDHQWHVHLTDGGAVLRATAQEDLKALSAERLSVLTGVPTRTLVDWISAGSIEGFILLGAHFAVPDGNGQYPVYGVPRH